LSRQRFLNMPVKARKRLLEVALKEFAERGFEEASLNEILAKVGISKGSYYCYCDDKEDLLATAIEDATDTLMGRLPLPDFDSLTAEEFWPAVERSVARWVEMFEAWAPLFQASLFLTETRRLSPRFAPVLAKARAFWTTLIEAGQRVGCVRADVDNDLLVRLVEANDQVLDTAFLATRRKLTRAAFEQHVRLVLDTFKRLLAVDPPASSPVRARAAPRARRG
jgi:AcrR family transcriptional regulator